MTVVRFIGRTAPHPSGRIRCKSTEAVVHIPKADIYRFGATSKPVFRDVAWSVNEGENWAVISSTSHEKHDFFQMLLGRLRINPHPPPPGGLFPLLKSHIMHERVSFVSFGNNRRASGGAFYDYTARYGAVHDEDRITLRQHMFPETIDPYGGIPEELRESGWELTLDSLDKLSPEKRALFESLVEKMDLTSFLDLPLIVLSNGQTRRARILKAIWEQPGLLLLDEPLTGLDVHTRPKLLDLLYELHGSRTPRIIIGLRNHDTVPEWITHVAYLRGTVVRTGLKDNVLGEEKLCAQESPIGVVSLSHCAGNIVADLRNIKVQYEDRKVIQNLTWRIRQGERWHLQGANGSGKTTLLSLLTGDHPQSYTQLPSNSAHLHLFGRPRSRIPTPELQSLIGVVSPEMFDAFPRRVGMSVWDVVGTGFDGTFVPRGKRAVGTGVMHELNEEDISWRVERCAEVIQALGPAAWCAELADVDEDFGCQDFMDLGIGEQRMVLLMRALVGRPQLVLLDEVWSGMSENMVNVAKRYLREGGVNNDQAVVVITHWEDEVPWRSEEGVKTIQLTKGGEAVFC